MNSRDAWMDTDSKHIEIDVHGNTYTSNIFVFQSNHQSTGKYT